MNTDHSIYYITSDIARIELNKKIKYCITIYNIQQLNLTSIY